MVVTLVVMLVLTRVGKKERKRGFLWVAMKASLLVDVMVVQKENQMVE